MSSSESGTGSDQLAGGNNIFQNLALSSDPGTVNSNVSLAPGSSFGDFSVSPMNMHMEDWQFGEFSGGGEFGEFRRGSDISL
jgi:hypothetical protein